jgi:heptosyltransferase-1
MSRKQLEKTPRNVLLVRLSARGDIVFSSPMVRAFRRTYPDVRITWLAESHTKNLIEHHPELDEILVWDRYAWKRLLKEGRVLTLVREARAFLAELRSRRFDLAVDMQGLLRSGLMTFLSGAPVRVGLRPKEGSQIFMTRVVDRHRNQGDRAKVSSEYLYLAQELGLDTRDFRMEVPLSAGDREFIDGWIREEGLEGGYAVAIPFTTRPQKHWFEDRWAELLDRLTREMGLPTVILGGPGDEAALGRIRGMAGSDTLSLVGRTSLTQAAGAIERAALVVGVDTGLTHMGIAFDRPTVTIFGSNIPYTEPPTDRARVLVHWLECSPCKGNPTCNGDYTCLKLIGVEDVLVAAREVMANGERERRRQEAEGDPGTPTDVGRAPGADGESAGPAHGAEERKRQEGP